jgi:hypothetical protein
MDKLKLATKWRTRMKIKILPVIYILFTFGSAFVTNAQSDLINRRWGIPKDPTNCETNAGNMEQILALMKEEPNPVGNIILIAHLSKQEKNRDLNRRRLFNVGERYRYTLKVPAEKIISAEGEGIEGFGRIEIYWNGELIGALIAQRNRDICVDSYADDKRYYPNKKH